jgi:hypothetical protein
VSFHLKAEQVPLGSSPFRAGQPLVQEAHDREEHLVGCPGVSQMQPQHPSAGERNHDASVAVGDDPGHALEPEPPKAVRKKRWRLDRPTVRLSVRPAVQGP